MKTKESRRERKKTFLLLREAMGAVRRWCCENFRSGFLIVRWTLSMDAMTESGKSFWSARKSTQSLGFCYLRLPPCFWGFFGNVRGWCHGSLLILESSDVPKLRKSPTNNIQDIPNIPDNPTNDCLLLPSTILPVTLMQKQIAWFSAKRSDWRASVIRPWKGCKYHYECYRSGIIQASADITIVNDPSWMS